MRTKPYSLSKLRFLILFFTFFFHCYNSFIRGNNYTQIRDTTSWQLDIDRYPDSIQQKIIQLRKTEGVDESIELYISIASWFKGADPNVLLYFANEMYEMAQKENHLKAEIHSLLFKGIAFFEKSNFDEGQDLIESALTKSDSISFDFGSAEARNLSSFYFHINSKNKEGVILAKQAIQIYEQLLYRKGVAAGNVNLGNCYKGLGQFNLAIVHLVKAMEYYETEKNARDLMNIYYNLAACYYRLGDIKNTEKYALQSIEYTQGIHLSIESSAMNILGAISLQKKNYDQAIKWFKACIAIIEQINSSLNLGVIYANIGSAYLFKSKPKQALVWINKAIAIGEKLKMSEALIPAYSSAGAAYTMQKNWNKALIVLNKCLALCERSGNQDYVRQILHEIADTYAKKRDYEEAYKYYIQYHEKEKEVFTIAKEREILEVTTKYETAKKDALLIEEKAITQVQKLELQRNEIGIAGLIILSLIFGFLVWLNKRQKKIVQSKNDQLSITNIALEKAKNHANLLRDEVQHRTKNHLQFVAGLLDLQSRDIADQVTQNAIIEGRNRIEAVGLLNQKLLYQEADPTTVNIQTYLCDLLQNLALVLDPLSKVKLDLYIDSLNLAPNKAMSIGLIINELVINAYKHIANKEEQKSVKIYLNQNGTLNLIIQDNGKGLPIDFEIQRPDSFGLKLVELLTQQLNGEMTINNQSGTRFEFKFQA